MPPEIAYACSIMTQESSHHHHVINSSLSPASHGCMLQPLPLLLFGQNFLRQKIDCKTKIRLVTSQDIRRSVSGHHRPLALNTKPNCCDFQIRCVVTELTQRCMRLVRRHRAVEIQRLIQAFYHLLTPVGPSWPILQASRRRNRLAFSSRHLLGFVSKAFK